MNIHVRQSGTVQIVELEGEVDLGTSPDLRRVLFDLLGGAQNLVVNLSALRYIDSSGIATLIEALKEAQRLRKQFVLCGLSPAVQEVFHLTHVHRVFRIVDTEEEAVKLLSA